MTSVVGEQDVAAAPRRTRPRTRWLLLAALVLVLAGGGSWAWHWRTHPTVFPPAGNQWSGPLREGQEFMSIGITSPEQDAGQRLVLHSVSPRIRNNSARATFEFYVCRRPAGESSLGMLSGQSAFDKYCDDPVRVHDRITLDTGGQQLVMLVRPHGPGVAATRGVRLTYSVGHQRGTQLIGPHVRIRSGG